jgi:phage shock protein C
MNPQFTRSANDKISAGVCGGIARYIDVDPVFVRLLFVLAVFLGGVSPLVYLVLWLIMPQEKVNTATTAPALPYVPDHPRPAEQWKYDPYTGEPVRR